LNAPAAPTPGAPSHWRRYRTLYLLIAVCVAPVLASYLAYYVLPPSGRTNYGALIEPQRPLPADLRLRTTDGAEVSASALRGQWTMVQVEAGECLDACRHNVWLMRQLRTAQGKDADRIDRVLLLVDGGSVDPLWLRDYEGTRVLRAERAQIEALLPLPPGGRLDQHFWLVDPLGNLMMRWPAQPDANRIKKDLGKLLKASRIG
jgi:hypothetical protein